MVAFVLPLNYLVMVWEYRFSFTLYTCGRVGRGFCEQIAIYFLKRLVTNLVLVRCEPWSVRLLGWLRSAGKLR